MIDFQNASFLKLKPVSPAAFESVITPMFVPGEQILGTFQSIRDGVVFTNKRIIAINVQGLTGQEEGLHVTSLQQDTGLLRGNCERARPGQRAGAVVLGHGQGEVRIRKPGGCRGPVSDYQRVCALIMVCLSRRGRQERPALPRHADINVTLAF